MPNYEYRCEKCGTKFEVLQKFSDQPLTTHENCGGKVERLVSAPAFNFKGSGWYVTDYAKGPKADGKADKSEKAEKPADNGTAAKAEKPTGGSGGASSTSTESKSETKSSSPDNK